MNGSLVNAKKIKKDPRNLVYLFPSIPATEYKRRTDDYYRYVCLQALEKVAAMTGKIVVPAVCIHWERKKKLADRRVKLFTKTYYIVEQNEISQTEYEKYKSMLN